MESVIYWLCITILLSAFCSILFQELKWMKKRRRSPPGPKGLPILGSLHLLGKNPYQDLFKLSKKHGPIMHMRFGCVSAIIVSSPEAAEKFLKTHDHSFATRPYNEAAWYMSYGQRDIVFAPYGSYLRKMRKLCFRELLSNQKISSFESMRRNELINLINSIKKAATDRVPVNLGADVSYMVLDRSSIMVFGKKYMDEKIGNRSIKEVIADSSHVAMLPNLGDFFPFLGVLDLQGLTRRYKRLGKELDGFLEMIIQDHVTKHHHDQQPEESLDFVDTMMGISKSGEADFEFDRRHVKSVLLDMLIASTETTSSSIEWAMTELLRHPNAMKKLQEEIQVKVGMKRMVKESDLDGLEYLDAVVKETLRLHPTAPLLLPHEAIEDCNIDGFRIKRKSRILVNIWAIGHDPNVWPDEPNTFKPERFLGRNIDIRGRDFRFIPFGSGRRICLGLQLGLTVFRLVLAQLVHCFNWELPNGMVPSDIDMNETYGLVTTKTKHLLAVPNYRLHA